jgi:hypothetical protein
MKKYLLFSIVITLLVDCVGMVVLAADPPEKAAQRAAELWMPLFDSGKYAESWDTLAEKTKAQLDRKTWETYLTTVRKPLGELKSRDLKEARFIKSLPGLPDQSGALLQYESSYKNRESVIETFGMILEKDGTWRVANYIPKE